MKIMSYFISTVLTFCLLSVITNAEIIRQEPTLAENKYDLNEDGVFDEDAYEISSIGELYWFADYVNSGTTNANAVLMNSIIINDNIRNKIEINGTTNTITGNYEPWTPINNFSGYFKGNGFSIGGAVFSEQNESNLGFFRTVSGTVKGLRLNEPVFAGIGNIGGIAGKLLGGGNIVDCNINNMMIISLKENTASNIGGICGVTEGEAHKSISYCSSSIVVLAQGTIGGIAGISDSTTTIEKCNTYHEESISPSAILSLNGPVGGIVGSNSGIVKNCYNETSIISGTTSGGIVGQLVAGSIENCFNASGLLTDELIGGGISGFPILNEQTLLKMVKNCYYLSTTHTVGFEGAAYATVDGMFESVSEEYMGTREFFDKLNAGQTNIWIFNEGSSPTLAPYGYNENDMCKFVEYSREGNYITFESFVSNRKGYAIFADYEDGVLSQYRFFWGTVTKPQNYTIRMDQINYTPNAGDIMYIWEVTDTMNFVPACEPYYFK